jgi:hypothetical protein
MKNLKKSIVAIAAIALMAPTFTSCKKVSNGKLNGEWDLTSGTEIRTTTENTAAGINTDVRTTVLDGKLTTSTRVFNGTPSGEPSQPYTSSYSFDKKNGTYVQTETTTEETEFTNRSAVNPEGVNKIIERKRTRTITTRSSGTFSITGNTGDIKRNSQIILLSGSTKQEWLDVFTYRENDVVFNPANWKESDGSTPLSASMPGESEYTASRTYGQVFNVDELKGADMTISTKDSEEFQNFGGLKTVRVWENTYNYKKK